MVLVRFDAKAHRLGVGLAGAPRVSLKVEVIGCEGIIWLLDDFDIYFATDSVLALRIAHLHPISIDELRPGGGGAIGAIIARRKFSHCISTDDVPRPGRVTVVTAQSILAHNVLLEGLAESYLPLLQLFRAVRALRTVRKAIPAGRGICSNGRSLKQLNIVLREDAADDTVTHVCTIKFPSRFSNDFIHVERASGDPRRLYKPIFELFIVCVLQIVPVIVGILFTDL